MEPPHRPRVDPPRGDLSRSGSPPLDQRGQACETLSFLSMVQVTSYLTKKFAELHSPNKFKVYMGHGGKPWVSDFNHPHYLAGRKALKTGGMHPWRQAGPCRLPPWERSRLQRAWVRGCWPVDVWRAPKAPFLLFCPPQCLVSSRT